MRTTTGSSGPESSPVSDDQKFSTGPLEMVTKGWKGGDSWEIT